MVVKEQAEPEYLEEIVGIKAVDFGKDAGDIGQCFIRRYKAVQVAEKTTEEFTVGDKTAPWYRTVEPAGWAFGPSASNEGVGLEVNVADAPSAPRLQIATT